MTILKSGQNTVKYARKDSEIRVEFAEKKGVLNVNNILTVKFINTGLIPSSADLNHIWKRDYRGVNAGNVKGTGIGLFTLKQICDISGITIDIKIEPFNNKVGNFIISLTFENCNQRLQIRE